MVGVAASAATGRYDAAILQPSDDVEAAEVASVAFVFSCLFSVILLVATLFVNFSNQNLPTEHRSLLFLGIGTVLLSAWSQILMGAAIRGKLFRRMSLARSCGALASAATTIGLGILGYGVWALALGVTVGFLAIALVLMSGLIRSYQGRLSKVTRQGIWHQSVRYKHFLFYSLPSDFANVFASSLPMLFLSIFFGPAVAGYFAMFQRIWAGSSILTQGLGETFRQRASVELRETGGFRQTMMQTILPLAAIASAAFLALVILGPTVFSLVLGENWHEAGVYGQILAPLVCLQFIASPVSWSFYITERLRLLMVWQFSLLIVFASVLFMGVHLLEARESLALYSLAGSVMYVLYASLSFRLSRKTVIG
jgi:O-antigen/teichoic acid export membrane protein